MSRTFKTMNTREIAREALPPDLRGCACDSEGKCDSCYATDRAQGVIELVIREAAEVRAPSDNSQPTIAEDCKVVGDWITVALHAPMRDRIRRICAAAEERDAFHNAETYDRERETPASDEARDIWAEILDKPHYALPAIQAVLSERDALMVKLEDMAHTILDLQTHGDLQAKACDALRAENERLRMSISVCSGSCHADD